MHPIKGPAPWPRFVPNYDENVVEFSDGVAGVVHLIAHLRVTGAFSGPGMMGDHNDDQAPHSSPSPVFT